MTVNKKIFSYVISCWILAIALVGCGQSESTDTSEAETVKEEPALPEILMEDLDDPSQWDQPRIQFVYSHPYEKNTYGNTRTAIWSAKVDGSDLRMVWSFGEFSVEDEGVTGHKPVRSPNNRYLAIGMNNNKGAPRVLVDLKTRQYWIMELRGGGPPGFTWTADSSAVIFNSRPGNWRYDLNTHTLSRLSDEIRGNTMYLLKDQKTLLGVSHDYYAYYDLATGKQLKKVELIGGDGLKYPDLSPNEDKLFYHHDYGMGGVDLVTDQVFFQSSSSYKLASGERLFFNGGIFHNLGNTVLYWDNGYFNYLDITNQTVTKGAAVNFNPMGPTLINKQVLWNQ